MTPEQERDYQKLKKQIASIITDSTALEHPKDWQNCITTIWLKKPLNTA